MGFFFILSWLVCGGQTTKWHSIPLFIFSRFYGNSRSKTWRKLGFEEKDFRRRMLDESLSLMEEKKTMLECYNSIVWLTQRRGPCKSVAFASYGCWLLVGMAKIPSHAWQKQLSSLNSLGFRFQSFILNHCYARVANIRSVVWSFGLGLKFISSADQWISGFTFSQCLVSFRTQ